MSWKHTIRIEHKIFTARLISGHFLNAFVPNGQATEHFLVKGSDVPHVVLLLNVIIGCYSVT